MRRRLTSLLLASIVVGLLVVAWLHASRDETTPVTGKAAARLVDADTSKDVERGRRPASGTYLYAGTGRDEVDAFGGARHAFPATVPAVVELDGSDACAWTLHVVFVKEHVEERSFCTTSTAVSDAGFSRTTSFLGHEQTSSYECSPDAIRVPIRDEEHDVWSWSCTERRGGVVHFTGRLLDDARLRIDGRAVTTRHVRIDGSQRGSSRGRERSEYWLTPAGLPVRMKSTRTLQVTTPLGTMRSDERYDYTLTSLRPTDD